MYFPRREEKRNQNISKKQKILQILLDNLLSSHYNNCCRVAALKASLDLAGCVGGREINV